MDAEIAFLRAKWTKMKAEMDAEIAFLRAKSTKMKAEMDAEIAVLHQKCTILKAYTSAEIIVFALKMHNFEGRDASRVANIRDGKGIGPFLDSKHARLIDFPYRREHLFFSRR